ncbi:hypothetical protein P262_05722 [Cronobacter malonaticus]|uniref:Uncharacterized protein n=1 Tax=Cronobacter malonaticus TaxID=413503 RepID=V5U6I9_9ENTR|nr:hypothetical protein P262_05722 [Cronobacter malonaticus]
MNSTGSAWGYGIRSDIKKAAEDSAAFYSYQATRTPAWFTDAPY